MWRVNATINPIYELEAHNDEITSVFTSSRFKNQLITSSFDKKVKVWTLNL